MGGLITAAILALGAVSASAAPNPGYGAPGETIVHSVGTIGSTGYVGPVINPSPTYVTTHEPKEDGPQTANVPTLAWVGEEVKLVACDDKILALPFDGLYETAAFSVENWTGDQSFQPTFNGSDASNIYINNQGSSTFFFPTGYEKYFKNCVSADVKSLHAGLTTIKLDVAAQCVGGFYEGQDGNGHDQQDSCGGLSTVQVYSEQFNVIWMTANQPTLSEASVASISTPGSPGTDAPPLTNQLSAQGLLNLSTGPNPFLGDPTGNGIFAADMWNQDTPWDSCGVAGTNNTPSNECLCLQGNGTNNGVIDQCDPSNNTPWTNNGLVQIKVTGSFPIEDGFDSTTNHDFFASLTGGANPGTITLPRQWAGLAALMATSSTSNTGTRPDLWDIHGGPTNALTHAGFAATCPKDGTVFTSPFDAVDDCATLDGINGNPYSFSRVFGDFTILGTHGPYDPQDPAVTLLSDGHLNSDDAPMPALPISLSIAPNAVNAANAPQLTPDPSPIGGIGGLYGVEKWLVYSHDFNLASGTPGNGSPMALTTTGQGNLYNPFYQEYIPSTTRPINEASGVDGVYDHGFTGSSGDNFPGFSNGYTNPYTFWTELANTTSDTGGSTACLRRDGQSDADTVPGGPGPIPAYLQPNYPTSGIVYTDERGEAYVDYNPGNGFFLNALLKNPGGGPVTNPSGVISIDTNGACDLQSLLGLPIGQSLISAQVEYPYQAVPYFAPKSSNSLTKVVDSKWSKTLISYPKGNMSSPDVSIFVATATDINGQPFVGEDVCFSVQGTGNPGVSVFQGIVPPTGSAPGADTNGATADDPPKGTSGYTCADTNINGQAAIEISGSDPGVDVTAWFVDERILRDVTTTLGDPTPVTSTTPPTVLPVLPVIAHSGNAGSAGGTSSTTSGNGPAVTPPVFPVGAANSCKVNSVHLFARKGYVALKVSCTQSKTDSIVVRTFRANGRLMHSYRKTIAAGKTVRIRLSTRRVAHVTVSA